MSSIVIALFALISFALTSIDTATRLQRYTHPGFVAGVWGLYLLLPGEKASVQTY